MATGGDGSEHQIQLGYGSCVWGTGRVTACPPGPGATQRSSAAGVASDQDELHQSGSYGEEDVTQSPPVLGSGCKRDGGGDQVAVAATCISGRAKSNSACGSAS